MDVMVQNKYGEYKPLDNEKIEPDKEVQLAYATGFVEAVNEAISDITKRFYFIGFRLDEANRYKYYEVLGYESIEELAEAEFGFKRASTYNYIQAFNYAKSETPLYIEDKFRGFSYTALLEMSKAKTVKRYNGSEGIEHILTPKVSVSKIKEVRPLWDKYIKENGELPNCKTVDEFMTLIREQEKPAPAPLLEMAVQTEENSVQSIGQKEPKRPPASEQAEPTLAVVDCELIKTTESNTDFVDGEDYSQYEEDEFVYMPDDELAKYCLKEGRHVNKFEIYDTVVNYEGTTDAFIKYIKNEYGNGGWGGGDKHYSEVNTSSKGFEIVRKTGGKLILSWNIVAGRIKRLIECGEYLTAAEQEQYLKWKADNEGLVVNVEGGQAAAEPEPSAEVLPISDKAKAKLLNLKNNKARQAWLDAFREWGVWLEVKEVDKTFYRYDFANGAALIVEVGFEYWNSWSTQKGAHERVSYSIIDEEHPKFNSQGECYTSVITWLSAHAKEV